MRSAPPQFNRSAAHAPVWAALAFPLALFAFACLFFGGDVGRWNDDYFFNQRDAASGDWSSLLLTRRDPYTPPADSLQPWRPIHFVVTPALVTLLWNHSWLINLVGVALHAFACFSMYRLARALGLTRHASGAAAALFALWAAHYEVVFWAAAFCTGFAAACGCWMLVATARFARGSWWWAAAVVALAWVIPRLNEQATGLVAAMPFVYLAACPDSERWGRRLLRAAVPAALASLVVIWYVHGVRNASQQGIGTNPDTYVQGLPALVSSYLHVIETMLDHLTLQNVAEGASVLGVRVLLQHPLAAVLWAAVLCIAGVCTWRAFVSTPAMSRERPIALASRPAYVLLALLAGALGACLPQATVGYPANSRTSYVVILFALLVLAWLADRAEAWMCAHLRPGADRARRVAVCAVLFPFALWLGVLMLGVQERYRVVAKTDAAQGAQLRALFPDPAPGTIFIPLAESHRRIDTGHEFFDRLLMSVWDSSWSTPFFIKNLYARNDVFCGYVHPRAKAVRDVTLEYLRYGWRFDTGYHEFPDESVEFPWEKVILFEIDAAGIVRPITRLVATRPDGSEVVAFPPQAVTRSRAGAFPDREFRIDLRPKPGLAPS